MGACGCGDHREGYKLPGPGGTIYHLSFYPGCRYCDTGPGWLIQRLPDEEDDDFRMREDPELRIYSYRGEVAAEGEEGHAPIPVINNDHLMESLKRIGFDKYDADEVPGAVRDAAWKTYDEWRKRERPTKEKP